MMKCIKLNFLFWLLAPFAWQPAAAWDLVDTHPDSPEFKQRFLGSYGINSAIEPKLTQEDRPLYESIEPYLQSNPLQAIELAQKGITEASNPAFDFLVGSLYYSLERYPVAADYLQAALKKFPDFRRAHRNQSLVYLQQAQYPKAIMHLLRVLELGGGDGQSYSLLGYAYLMEEKYQSALSAYQMARLFLPDSRDVRLGEAQCLLMMQQYGAAIALFDELLTESPEDQSLWLFQANGFLSQAQLEDAIANLEIAHAVAEPTAASLSLLGDLYLREAVLEPALTNYQLAVQADPQMRPEQALKPLRQLIQLSRYPQAAAYLALLEQHLQSRFSPSQLREKQRLQAELLIQDGAIDAGLALLDFVLAANPLDGDALLLRARAELERAAYEAAEFYFERAVHLPEFQIKGLIGLARTAVAESQYSRALAHLKKSQLIQARDDVASYMRSIERVLSAQPMDASR